jgi:hypothetical protein
VLYFQVFRSLILTWCDAASQKALHLVTRKSQPRKAFLTASSVPALRRQTDRYGKNTAILSGGAPGADFPERRSVGPR